MVFSKVDYDRKKTLKHFYKFNLFRFCKMNYLVMTPETHSNADALVDFLKTLKANKLASDFTEICNKMLSA